MTPETVVVSAISSILVAIVTAYTTHRLTARAERQKWSREVSLKYAEATATEPQRASALARQFGMAVLLVRHPIELGSDAPPMETGSLAKVFLLPNSRIVIGRAAPSAILINEPTISRQHALITTTDSTIFIQDLESRSGVEVNGERITEKRKLSTGDTITIGTTWMILRPLEG